MKMPDSFLKIFIFAFTFFIWAPFSHAEDIEQISVEKSESDFTRNIELALFYAGAPKEVIGIFSNSIDYDNFRGVLNPKLEFLKYKSDHTDLKKSFEHLQAAWTLTDETLQELKNKEHFREELIDIALKYRFLALGFDIG